MKILIALFAMALAYLPSSAVGADAVLQTNTALLSHYVENCVAPFVG